ncbi:MULTISPECIES: M48 family metallopeptidase [unclassified Rhizobium]|uniref:M48 family metallopeptidase n=1 Tax=unclassified Rhizobium TaxID=2613769 RepID=UPI001C83A56C|nr:MULTISPECIES: SprT family zinc-dependent metalloprotease [unclassified Rhizobium]MBX5165311.1 M48 family metallopeptidase [Rhizobium sp. NZLR4b]MBX5209021.1 M48 family metallopeptidase [Rhizobium sp. NZLR11]
MREIIEIGDMVIDVTRKSVKHVHLSVHPPNGRVTLVAPSATRLEVARAYAISKLGWIRDQQTRLMNQVRESPRQFIGRESHFLWGRRYLMSVIEKDERPSVKLDHRTIHLTVRPESSPAKRAEVIHEWHKTLLHGVVPGIIRKWEARLGVKTSRYFLQRMKTKWGGCNPTAATIRLNTELVKKPKDLLEYVIVHELTHLLEPRHSERFFELMSHHYPAWPEARKELNELPLGAEDWPQR